MKLALRSVRRNLRAKSAPPIDSAISTFRAHPKNCRVVSVSNRGSSGAKRHACKSFRMNTCESVSKQRTLTAFKINTYEKQGEGGGI